MSVKTFKVIQENNNEKVTIPMLLIQESEYVSLVDKKNKLVKEI
jgi:hypothetical protein